MSISSNAEQVHVVPYPFPMAPTIEGKISGGLPAVLAAEFSANRGRLDRALHFVCTDPQPHEYIDHNARVLAAEPSSVRMPFDTWFYPRWAYLHPDAHTAPVLQPAALQRLYPGTYTHPVGSVEQMVEHCRIYPASDGQNIEPFVARFRPIMDSVVASSNPEAVRMNWQDPLFFGELAAEYAPQLRAAGIRQSMHVHTALPDSLDQSEWGQSMVDVLAQMDTVYVHTEEYRSALERLFGRRNIAQIPDIRRFDLMVDIPLLRTVSDQMSDVRASANYAGLTGNTKETVDEILRTKEGSSAVPHRFINLDRADLGKGTLVLIESIDTFLDSELQKGLTKDDLRQKYRFFGFHDQMAQAGAAYSPHNVKDQYAALVLEKYTELQAKYPGVVFWGSAIPKDLAIEMMDDCDVITACTHDGLNLAWPETVWVNSYKGRNRYGVMAQGAGFAKEAVRLGHADPALFPPAGDSQALANGIATLVHIAESDPAKLLQMARRMSQQYIEKRLDSVVVA